MEPHMGRAECPSSPSAEASPSVSLASGVDRGSHVGSWPRFSLVGKHREGFCADSPAALRHISLRIPNTGQVLGTCVGGKPLLDRLAQQGADGGRGAGHRAGRLWGAQARSISGLLRPWGWEQPGWRVSAHFQPEVERRLCSSALGLTTLEQGFSKSLAQFRSYPGL